MEELRPLIQHWRADPGGTYQTWFLWKDRLRNFGAIRRGLLQVVEEIKTDRFGNLYRGSSLEAVAKCVAEQKQIFKGADHAFLWKPKLRIPDIYESRLTQQSFGLFLDTCCCCSTEQQVLSAVYRLDQQAIKGLGPAAANLLYFLHPTLVPPFNTAIVKGYNLLSGAKVKLGSWKEYLAMREGILRINREHQTLLSNDLGAIGGLLFGIGTERYPVPPGAADPDAQVRWKEDLARLHELSAAEIASRKQEESLERTHTQVQGWLRDLGLALGCHVWIANNDRGREYNGGFLGDRCLSDLPESLRKTEEGDAVQTPEVPKCLNNLASLLVRQHREMDAVPLVKRAIDLLKRLPGRARPRNQGGVTATLQVHSPNSQPVYFPAWKDQSPEPTERITVEDVRNRWAEISLYNEQPLTPRLSGLALQYAILQIHSRDAGQRMATLSFDVGPGTQDIGSDRSADLLFNAKPAAAVRLEVADDDGTPTIASFLVRDHLGRIYPNPSKRLAPDFFFQPQVYRRHGESMRLPDGAYDVICTGGPEYITEERRVNLRSRESEVLSFRLKRWIHPAELGWYPGDHHIHAAGCSHYVTPTEGVDPVVMMRQVEGEHLSVGCVLNWAPCYYHQKQFFTGQDDPLSTPATLLHYDLEISGFPSSHCGHLTLLGLKEQSYPGAKRIEDWPTWNLPILKWAKAQGALTGFAHSGWGLAVKSDQLPNYEMPAFDAIGANEFIVDVTHPGAVDFISAGDTPYVWELNIWYQVLNVGFRTRISGETDFPSITDNRVGRGRLYAQVEGKLSYNSWLKSLLNGRSYISDGKSHLVDFTANGVGVGVENSELQLSNPGNVAVTVQAAAYLDSTPPTLPQTAYDKQPYWDIERARIAKTRDVKVELVWNGRPVGSQRLFANGVIQKLQFDFPVNESGWMALRILPSCHTNPIFVRVAGKPMRPLKSSAQWCLDAVNQCWSQKALQISANEIASAKEAYEHARQVYSTLLAKA